ncbi:poly(A) polymerase [Solemya pervernicosa gill symbiont]|uniref:Poly(A) polymerase I n=2 Tax=Gammaproteobacteria incertae sedis TaxID=118884 RepID=A0A1T2L9N6_9GAMM|nr:polynucleotide adenylyltransferase PcnB [Candidatus Reidiella endopervernicosa]OOZ41815.1 poly(A) polymerase [Solemya pervernicosa gill symbiont]QKQ26230.1 polynucleotide adenylyltransferase PcnB [Candidatus Reidiella endopervernicosa]
MSIIIGIVNVIPRSEHNLSRRDISDNALKVLYRLKDAGYHACLVGGGVRDLLLGLEPKDFDVATDATPEEVRRVFRNCRLIGRRFRLAHVHFGHDIIEVATFRGSHQGTEGDDKVASVDDENGRILRDNVFGTIEEDAIRRDFTVNALYYDIDDYALLDYATGLDDLRNGVLRLIGDAETRYREDPVRMLRAARFAVKLGFTIHDDCAEPIHRLANLLEDISPARLFEEVLKLFQGGKALQSFEMLRHYGLFNYLFPLTEAVLAHEEEHFPITLVASALENTDKRISIGKPVSPAFLFAALLWESVRHRADALLKSEEATSEIQAMQRAGGEVASLQAQHTSIPKRYSMPMREIWSLQPRFSQRSGRRAARLHEHPRFRAAYDLLLLRAKSGEVEASLADWWTRYQEVGEKERQEMVQKVGGEGGKKKRRRRRKRPAAKKSNTEVDG